MDKNQDQQSELYSVSSFCAAHSISRSFFYKLLKNGEAPLVIKLGKRTLISKEAAAEWRKKISK